MNPYRPIGNYRSLESMAAFLDEVWNGSDDDDGSQSGEDTELDWGLWSD